MDIYKDAFENMRINLKNV